MSFSRRNLLKNVVAGAGLAMGAQKAHGKGASKGFLPAASSGSAAPGRSEVPSGPDPLFEKPGPITLAELANMKIEGVRAVEVSDYVYGNYKGDFPSPPHADFNPKKAIIIVWEGKPNKFVFWHEASYSPYFELPSGAGPCFQFWEGNLGHELFNQYGRMERNSFVDIIENGPKRVWVRWTYFGMHVNGTGPAYRGTDDFISYANGILWRRQTYRSFWPDKHEGQCASSLDFFSAIPAGVHYSELLPKDEQHRDYQVAAFLDAYSDKQYSVYWDKTNRTKGPFYARRTGAEWFLDIERSRGKAAVQTFRDGLAYCAFGDASGHLADRVQLWDNSHPDTGPCGWGNLKWLNWPVGWINSAGTNASDKDIMTMPYCICPVSVVYVSKPFPMNADARKWDNITKDWYDKEQERWVEVRVFYCLHGVEQDFQTIRNVSRQWLDKRADCARPESVKDLRTR